MFTTPTLPENWHVRYSREGGSFMSVSNERKEGAFQARSTRKHRGTEGTTAQTGVKIKRQQAVLTEWSYFLWMCPVPTFLTADAFDLKLQQVFHKTRVRCVDSDSQAILAGWSSLHDFVFKRYYCIFSLWMSQLSQMHADSSTEHMYTAAFSHTLQSDCMLAVWSLSLQFIFCISAWTHITE